MFLKIPNGIVKKIHKQYNKFERMIKKIDSVLKFCVKGKDTSLAKSQARRHE
jgi:hypothetical protein